MEDLNQLESPTLMRELSEPPELERNLFLQRLSFPGTVSIDTRPWSKFTFDGVEGALHVPLDRDFAPIVAGAVAGDERVVFICARSQVGDITRTLHLVGIDAIDGWISDVEYAKIDREVMTLSEIDDISQHAARRKHQEGEAIFLDVRTTAEWLRGRIAGAKLMTLTQIPEQINQIPRGKCVIAYCAAGGRSARAGAYLRRNGIDCATLKGGYWPWFGRDFPVDGADRPFRT